MGETYAMDITLRNPLPSDITINQLEVLHGNSQLTCIGAKQITIPAHSSISTRVYLIPNAVGELILTGVRVGSLRCLQNRSIYVVFGVTLIQIFTRLFTVTFSKRIESSYRNPAISPVTPHCFFYSFCFVLRRILHVEGRSTMHATASKRYHDTHQVNQRREARGCMDLYRVCLLGGCSFVRNLVIASPRRSNWIKYQVTRACDSSHFPRYLQIPLHPIWPTMNRSSVSFP